jgi:hypothetical protein
MVPKARKMEVQIMIPDQQIFPLPIFYWRTKIAFTDQAPGPAQMFPKTKIQIMVTGSTT